MRGSALLAGVVAGALGSVPGAAWAHSHGHGGGAAGGAAAAVSVGFAAFGPAHLDVVAGEVVRWSNDSVRAHTVTAEDGSFDSGRLPANGEFSHRFERPGSVRYVCELHAGMTGEVAAHELLLDAPSSAAAPRREFPVSGRSSLPAGSPVVIESAEGPLGRTAVGPDGGFSTSIVPTASTELRAVSGEASSPPRRLLVLDRRVRATARRRSVRTVEVRVRVTPASPGALVVAQVRIPERFGWWPVQQVRLGRASTATFRLPLRRRLPVRAVLTLPDGATVLARSAALRPDGRAPRGRAHRHGG